MSVKIIRPNEPVKFSFEPRKVRIEFLDGSYLIGYINIHARYKGRNTDSENETMNTADQELIAKYNRTSDYLKNANRNEGVITVFNATYGGQIGKTCFIFLHSIKLIMEEEEGKTLTAAPPAEPDDKSPAGGGFSLRERVKRPE